MPDHANGSQDPRRLFVPGGRLADRFRIVREVARGGMGVVYEAIDEKLDRRIAIKAAQAGHARLLSPEVRNASAVSHPNVCRIFELHSARTAGGDVDFLTMEYLDGETLAQVLRRRRPSEGDARAIGGQLCAGLAEAHRNHIVHGDLKPQNVILTRATDGALRAVITDFGLAQGPDSPGSSGGTRGYMAPELIAGGPISVASDVYALGVILHELVTGLRPSEHAAAIAPTISSPGHTAGSGEMPALRPSGTGWDPILRRCLAPDPAARYASVAELQRALDPPRGRRGVIAASLLVVVAIAAIAYWRVTAPPTTVKLAFRSDTDLGRALAELRGTHARGLKLVRDPRHATHLVEVHVGPTGDSTVTVDVIETRTKAKLAHWEGVFAPEERAFVPAAVAGVTSTALHLAPAPARFRDESARRTYEQALPLLRDDARIDSAWTLMRRAAAVDPASPLPWAGAAEAEWRKYYLTHSGEWLARARESVRRAELRGMDTPEVHRIAGLLEANEGRFTPAIARYVRATELPATNADAWRRLGDAYRRNNQPDLGLAALRKAVEVEPGFSRNHQDLGQWYFSRGDYVAAIPEMREAVRLAPDAPRLRSNLAAALTNVGEFRAAEAELRAALSPNEDPAALVSLGQVLMYQSRDREAIPLLRRGVERDSTLFLGFLYLGECLASTGQPDESRAAFARSFAFVEREVERTPNSGYPRGFLAYLCARLGDARRAAGEIAQALQSSPDNADVLWEAALTYEKLGRRDDAVAVLKTAPRSLLEDLARWPGANPLTRDARFQKLLHASPTTP